MKNKQENLKKAFNKVCNPDDWKAPINAVILKKDLELTREAIIHFTATVPRVNEINATHAQVIASGYRMGPAGDH